jgi:hypothetical protein
VWNSRRMAVLDGRQVRCTTFDEGSVWIHRLDSLPPPVRRRLANSRFNICPTCVYIDRPIIWKPLTGLPHIKTVMGICGLRITLGRTLLKWRRRRPATCSSAPNICSSKPMALEARFHSDRARDGVSNRF